MNFQTKLLQAKHIFNHLLNGRKTLNSIQKINNPTLNILAETILQIQKNEFSQEDKEAFNHLEEFKKELAESNEIIDYKIFNIDETMVVNKIFSIAASPEIWCKFLYLLTKKMKAKNFLEIGTNLGVSGAYILSAQKNLPESHFVTLEGAPKLCAIAEKQFKTIVPENRFNILQGLYENTFPEALNLPMDFDVFFIDGNHQLEPTLHYFNSLKSKINSPCIFIFDDIYWNAGMIEAWKKIKTDAEINFAVDFFRMGIVIIDKNEQKRNVDLKYYID